MTLVQANICAKTLQISAKKKCKNCKFKDCSKPNWLWLDAGCSMRHTHRLCHFLKVINLEAISSNIWSTITIRHVFWEPGVSKWRKASGAHSRFMCQRSFATARGVLCMGDPGSSWLTLGKSESGSCPRQYQDLDRWWWGAASSFPQWAEVVQVGAAESWNVAGFCAGLVYAVKIDFLDS